MGRIEVKFGSGRLSRICVKDIQTAIVICNQLGLTRFYAGLADGSSFGRSKSPLLDIAFDCKGNENNVAECGLKTATEDCDFGIVCDDYVRPYIVSESEMYPLMEGRNRALKCVTPKTFPLADSYTWLETAGGRPDHDLLIFDNLTKENNGRLVECKARNTIGVMDSQIQSGNRSLNVYYKPLIRITWTDNLEKQQQPLSNLSDLNSGQNVTLWCEADSNPPPASITWSGRVNSTTGELRIIGAEHVTHSGLYTCTVVSQTVDDDDRLPLTSSYQLTLSVRVRVAPDAECSPSFPNLPIDIKTSD